MLRQSEINELLEELDSKKMDIRRIAIYYEEDNGKHQTRFCNITTGNLCLIAVLLEQIGFETARQSGCT